MNEELATRARQLIKVRGRRIPADYSPYYREFYLGDFWMTISADDRLEIRSVSMGADLHALVYSQQLPTKWGRLVYPELVPDLLNLMRQLMILDDLSKV
jgi:hypothetical protein